MTRSTRIAKALAASVVAALALCAAATAGGPTISAGYGCAVACIQSALVTPTASSASVEVKTTVPASVTVVAAKLDADPGLAAGPAPKHVSVPAFLTARTVLLPGLEPATTYRIVVTAKDLQGRVQTRSGTFTTLAVKVAVGTPDLGLQAGLGCKAACIEKALLRNDATVPGRVHLEMETSVPATMSLTLLVKTIDGKTLHFFQHVTGSRKTAHTATFDRLLTGTTYRVTARATDAEGRTRLEQGTFRTNSAVATVTFHKIKVIDDADNGSNAGEIAFEYKAGDVVVGGADFSRIDSGETVAAKAYGAGRPGVMITQSVDRRRTLELDVAGYECDWTLLKNCVTEAGESFGNANDGRATLQFDVRDAMGGGALPPGYGSDLPAGHDAYPIWETTSDSLKFRVYATVDLRLAP